MTRRVLCLLLLLSAAPGICSMLPVYFSESFDAPGIPAGWSLHQIAGPAATWAFVGTGSHPPVPPFAGMGQAQFNSYDAGPGEQARLVTPAVTLTASIDPFVEFMFHHDDEFPGVFDSVYVEATTGDSVTGPWTVLRGIRRPDATTGWERLAASVLDFSGQQRVFIGLRGVSRYGNNMHLDEFRIADSTFHDIGTIALSGGPDGNVLLRERSRTAQQLELTPPPVQTPGEGGVTTFVRNFGTHTELAYEVYWDIDFNLQSPLPNARPLPRNGQDTFLLPLPELEPGMHAVRAWTMLDTDSNKANDTTSMTLLVPDTTVIFVQTFGSELFPPAGWTAINRDGSTLGPWFRGSTVSVFLPLEGSGFAANNFQRANGQYIDDYLISPALTGVGQTGMEDTLTFWVRSALNQPPFANYPDSLMVLLSTSGTDTSDFTVLVDYLAVPKGAWTLRQYNLSGLVPPNSTVHIAFRYLHHAGGPTGGNSDFIGLDLVQVRRGLAASVPDALALPSSLHLDQNYPNPFNPATRIRYHVPARGPVRLRVFDMLGRQASILADGVHEAGTYDAVWNAAGLSSGVYVCRLESNGVTATRTMLLLR